MRFEVYDDTSVFTTFSADIWNELLQRSVTNTIFLTHEWQSNWWKVYKPGDLRVFVIWDEDELVGIVPMYLETQIIEVEVQPEKDPDADDGDADEAPPLEMIIEKREERVLRFVGGEDVSDYLDFIIDYQRAEPILRFILEMFVEQQENFDRLLMNNIPASSPSLAFFRSVRQSFFELTLTEQDVAPFFKVPESWDTYLEGINKKQRQEIKRKLRRVEGGDEEVVWYVVDNSHDLKNEVDDFLELMTKSDANKQQFLKNKRHAKWFKTIAPIAYKQGWLELMFLTVDGEKAAGYLNFVYGNNTLVYNSGFDFDQYGYLGAGIVLLSYSVQHAIESKRQRYDFLCGDEEYKYRMGGKDMQVLEVTLRTT